MQRSVEDPSYLVAIYEGKHNHIQPNGRLEYQLVGPIHSNSNPDYASVSSPSRATKSPSPIIQDLQIRRSPAAAATATASSHQIMVQQMASFLTRDPNFTTALATAIIGTNVQKEIWR